MDRILPWAEIEARAQAAADGTRGPPRCQPVRQQLRAWLLQHWFDLTDEALEEALLDCASMRQFALMATPESAPDEASIAAFRRQLSRSGAGEEILGLVQRELGRHGIRVKEAVPGSPRPVEVEGMPRLRPGRPVPLPPAPPGQTQPGQPAAVELALEALGVGVLEWEPGSQTLHLSPRCRQILGLGPDETPSRELLQTLVHPDDRPRLPALYASAQPQAPGFSCELRVIRPDGTRRWVHVSGRAAPEDGGSASARSCCTLLDVTDQRLAERRVYELDSQLSTFMDEAPACVASFDRNMCFLEVSRQYAEDRGVTPAQLLGRCLYEAFPEIPERWRAVHARCLAGASERCERDLFVRPDGRREWVSWEVRPWYRKDQTIGGLLLFSEVITQRVHEQLRLHESETRLAVAIRAGALGIYDYDLRENTTTWDQRVREIWGVSAGEKVTYETFLAGVHEEDRATALKALEDSLGPCGNGTHASEYRVVNRRDGTVRWISSTATVYFNHGRAVRLAGFVQDITGRKRAELDLARNAAELRQADQRKDDFLATLSHELRNPLAPIRTAAQILASPELTPGQMQRAQQMIQRQTAHMTSLLNDLLDIARITRGKLELKKERVALMAIVEPALEAAQPLLDERRHRLTVSLAGLQALQLTVDPVRISQVLTNLLRNAAKYTPEGGEIALSACLAPSGLMLAVKDNGAGIPQDALLRIFDMFWQVQGDGGRHAQSGLGIGLALVKSLVEMHGGTVQARSEGPGRGSELTVCLPVSAGASLPPRSEPPRPALLRPAARLPSVRSVRRVLVADDDPDTADSLGMLLTLAHHEVRVAHGGRDALALAEGFRPEVALVNISMPDLDGYAVARALRETAWAAGICLIAITGKGTDKDKQRSHAAGFDHHVTKPVGAEVLEQLLAAPQQARLEA